MSFLGKIELRLRALWQRGEVQRDIDEELRFHLEQRMAENIEAGMTPEAAAREARKRFGNLQAVREECREKQGIAFGEEILQDIRFGFRMLRKTPGFTAVAVLLIGIGVGANTAVFSFVDRILLRQLPVHRPEELVFFRTPGDGLGMQRSVNRTLSLPMVRHLHQTVSSFSGFAASWQVDGGVILRDKGGPESVNCVLVSGGFFSTLGLAPAVGRLFTPDDNRSPNGHPVLVLSYGFWQRRFGGDSAVVGRSITVNTTPMTIIGVASAGFGGLSPDQSFDVAVPIMMKEAVAPWSHWSLEDSHSEWLFVFARLKAGCTPAQADAAANAAYQARNREIAEQHGSNPEEREQFASRRLIMERGDRGLSYFRDEVGGPLLVLQALAGAVLLLTGANLGGLLLVRSLARQREYAVRLALGASRWRMIRAALIEAEMLALGGTAVGWLVCHGMRFGLLSVWGNGAGLGNVELNSRHLLFGVLTASATVLLCGLAAVLRAFPDNPGPALQSAARTTHGRAAAGWRRAFVVTQIALAMCLVTAAGWFTRTLRELNGRRLGVDAEQIVLATVNASLSGRRGDAAKRLYDELRERLATLPGVRGVAYASEPLTSTVNGGVLFLDESDRNRRAYYQGYINGGGLTALGIPLLAGRDFVQGDERSGAVIVSESVARKCPGGAAVGCSLRVDGGEQIHVIGVVPDIAASDARLSMLGRIFWPRGHTGKVTFHVRTTLAPAQQIPAIRKVFADLAPDLAVNMTGTLSNLVADGYRTERLLAALAAVFGGVAVLLGALGIYGLFSYFVTLRISEIGLRLALGAAPRGIAASLLRDTLQLAGTGIVIGLVLSLGAGPLVRGILYGIAPADSASLATSAAVLLAVALVACWLPARRAAKVDPMEALRCE